MIYLQRENLTLHQGDALTVLKTLEKESAQVCVCSPPYFNLRSYLPDSHEDKHLEFGLETNVEEYISRLVEMFEEVKRVLRKDGTLWVNLGDSYASGSTNPSPKHSVDKVGRLGRPTGIFKAKDMCLIPHRFAIAMQEAGWYVRMDICWNKMNAMPESVIDRPSLSHEYIFLFSKSAKYFYDNEAVKEKASVGYRSTDFVPNSEKDALAIFPTAATGASRNGRTDEFIAMRNMRSVWSINTRPYSEAHFAVFAPEIPKRAILAGTSEVGCCPACGTPYKRVIEKGERFKSNKCNTQFEGHRGVSGGVGPDRRLKVEKGWEAGCRCNGGNPVPCTVLDCFSGAGTSGMVALQLGRKYIGIELNKEYLDITRKRLEPAMCQELLDLW